MNAQKDIISFRQASTLHMLFLERVKRSAQAIAYKQFDPKAGQWNTYTWQSIAEKVEKFKAALAQYHYSEGDRVAIMFRNSIEWIIFDQAALSLGLVIVPLYTDDRPDNVAYILQDSGSKLLYVESDKHWNRLALACEKIKSLEHVIVHHIHSENESNRTTQINEWITSAPEVSEIQVPPTNPDTLATIVYTSGTTGNAKGVMLSHRNILFDIEGGLDAFDVLTSDIALSFLPLSHALERTIGYYLTLAAGAQVIFARSIPQLGEDLSQQRPTILISVPRIYERVYGRIQDQIKKKSRLAKMLFHLTIETGWQHFEYTHQRSSWKLSFLLFPMLNKLVAAKIMRKLGGRMRIALCGGAAMSPTIAKVFISLGLPLYQGYGLTEASPVVTVNHKHRNRPDSIGIVLTGQKIKISEQDELLVKGDNVMLGYWNNEQATKEVIDSDNWLHTGDKARIDSEFVYITGRIKEIIVMANGEKMPPADMEMAIALDSLFEQVMIFGEAKPYLCALVILNKEEWEAIAKEKNFDPNDLDCKRNRTIERFLVKKLNEQLHEFPGYAKVRRLFACLEPWSVDNGMMTPTMKLKRNVILKRYENDISHMYGNY